MVKKRENYILWLKQENARRKARRERRKLKRKAKKIASRTWKAGCLVTFKTLDNNRKYKVFICRMKKVPSIKMNYCAICKMLNGNVPCLNIRTDTHTKCQRKRAEGVFPLVIGYFDKHERYHCRNV